jgi:hypothetical protein
MTTWSTRSLDEMLADWGDLFREARHPKIGEVHEVREMIPSVKHYRWDRLDNGDIVRHQLTPEEVSIYKANKAVDKSGAESGK